MNNANRKWAIEQAVLSKSKDVIATAETYLKFIGEDVTTTGNPKTDSTEERGERIKQWPTVSLSTAKQAVLAAMIKRWNKEEPINGVLIAKDLKMSQSNASLHMAFLTKNGYAGRKGNKYWPLKTLAGADLPVPVYKVPAGIAKGYQGTLKAPMSEFVA